MEGKCTECGCNKLMHFSSELLCYDCYEDMFKTIFPPTQNSYEPNDKAKLDPLAEEPDFVLKSEVADIKNAIDNDIFVATGINRHLVFRIPKRYVFDKDARVKDYDRLVEFILDNMNITEHSKGFDKVKYMFKESE